MTKCRRMILTVKRFPALKFTSSSVGKLNKLVELNYDTGKHDEGTNTAASECINMLLNNNLIDLGSTRKMRGKYIQFIGIQQVKCSLT